MRHNTQEKWLTVPACLPSIDRDASDESARGHTEGESLSAEDIALPTATEGREPGLASMGTIWTWRRWTSSLPTLLPSLRVWMVDAQQYHVPRGVCKKSIIPAAHRVHSDQSLSSLEDVWHTQGAGI